MRNLEGAKCVGKWSLFDSRNLNDHLEARELCKTCPVQLACAGLLHEVMHESSGGATGMPQGTWAGRLLSENHVRSVARCGTESGYTRHRRRDEDACADCTEARRVAEARRSRARKAV